MMLRLFYAGALALVCMVFPVAHANTTPITVSTEKLHELANSAYWKLLLRYEPARTQSGVQSEARSSHYFLADTGRDSPLNELKALIAAVAAPEIDNNHAACRFPARTRWLYQQIGISAPDFSCPAYDEWRGLINPQQATLVFASDYLNNPSSMFGHTFLRLDAPGQTEDTRLLAYAVNYAAQADAKNPFTFAYKGLTGGYPGVFSLMPYYEKVKEYSDMENRDLWEYQLSLAPDEIRLLLSHLWELRSVEFPYYFLTRNCSFQLLALLEVARPGLSLRHAFPVQAIPTDTVRRVLEEPGMLKELTYRPAAERQLLMASTHFPKQVNQAAIRLTQSPEITTGLSPEEEAAALETAFDYSYYQFMAGSQTSEHKRHMRHLLVRRAAIDLPEQRLKPAQPIIDPAGGHPTARIAVSAGHARKAGYMALKLRPAYHDLLDPPAGYRQGAHIDFLDGEIRLDDDSQHLRLEKLSAVDIDSLATLDTFFKPVSWYFGFGWRQAAVNSTGNFSAEDHHGVAYMDGGAGYSLQWGSYSQCFLQLGMDIEAGNVLDTGWRTGIGPRTGCLVGGADWRMRLQSDLRWRNAPDILEHQLRWEVQKDLGSNHAIRLQTGLIQADHQASGQLELGWVHYY
jgi:hypothetical protein